jgi:hypothetical protein
VTENGDIAPAASASAAFANPISPRTQCQD